MIGPPGDRLNGWLVVHVAEDDCIYLRSVAHLCCKSPYAVVDRRKWQSLFLLCFFQYFQDRLLLNGHRYKTMARLVAQAQSEA